MARITWSLGMLAIASALRVELSAAGVRRCASPSSPSSSRRSFLASAAAASAIACTSVPALAEIDPGAAADLVREKGVIASTGKGGGLPLIGLLVAGIGVAAYLNRPGSMSDSEDEEPFKPAIGLYSDEAKRLRGEATGTEAYEASAWTTGVDLPWMQQSTAATPPEEEAAPLEQEEPEEA